MIKKHIPNLLTSGNLFCGCIAIVEAFNGNLHISAYLVGLAAIFDFLDGFAARLLKVQSPMGKELDSLADMVSFGLLPGIIVYHLLLNLGDVLPNQYFAYVAFLIPIFSALRLANFNIDTRQSDSFIGVPTPAVTLLIASFPLICLEASSQACLLINNIYFLTGITVLMSYLLVAELPLFALKFKDFTFQNNKIRYIFIGVSVLLLVILHYVALPIIIFLYILISIISNLMNSKKVVK
jgi:CDP-diacylglycerol--serine O-phosphatidyltransferase